MINLETHNIEFSTKGHNQLVDLTDRVQQVLNKSAYNEGNITLFAIGSTTGLSTVEYEPGLVHHDVAEMYQKIAPYGVSYHHNQTWGDDNGAAHLRSTLTGSSLVVPFVNQKLVLGTWQQIIHLEADVKPRQRSIVVTVTGD